MSDNYGNLIELICSEEQDELIEFIIESDDEGKKSKRKYTKCDPENLEKAAKAVKLCGMSYRDASKEFNVSRSSLENKIKQKTSGKWGNFDCIFTEEEEKLICEWIFPKSKEDIIRVSNIKSRKKATRS